MIDFLRARVDGLLRNGRIAVIVGAAAVLSAALSSDDWVAAATVTELVHEDILGSLL